MGWYDFTQTPNRYQVLLDRAGLHTCLMAVRADAWSTGCLWLGSSLVALWLLESVTQMRRAQWVQRSRESRVRGQRS